MHPDDASISPSAPKLPRKYRVAWALAACIVASYYLWQTNAAFNRFVWSDHLEGSYDLLARGFLRGHLYMDVEPRPELLALPDPWKFPDNTPYRLLDTVLYNRHYYLYHGPTAALLLYAPWRLITGHDMPQAVSVMLFSFGGFLLLSELLMAILAARASPPPLWLFVLFCFAVGLAQGCPFLLQESLMYQVAISSGFFFLSGGYLFLFRTFRASYGRPLSAALAGLCFGLAVGCRPHLALAILPASLLLLTKYARSPAFRRPRQLASVIAFGIPILLCAIAICAYNYARFGSVFEFGLKYLLGDPSYADLGLSAVNLLPGLYYLLACAPNLDPVFPFFRLAVRPPFNSVHYVLPLRYAHEPIAGALYCCPLILIGLATPVLVRLYRDRPPVWSILVAIYSYATACVVFIALLGTNSQRYEVDFLPFLLLISCVLAVEAIPHLRRMLRPVASTAICIAVIYALAINVCVGMQGFVDEWLRTKPEQFVRVATWFSPVRRFRPVLNPRVDVKAYFQFPQFSGGWFPHPLIVTGEFGSRYALLAEGIAPGRLLLISQEGWSGPPSEFQSAVVSLETQHNGFNLVEARYDPAQRVMFVYWNNQLVVRHRLQFLITAPSQIELGLDSTFLFKRRFPFPIVMVTREIT
ncbi:MAG: hypothetical protein M3N54_06725 [Acidobacteriota bacterium]|nr:hypothetical protein [Acidobacteriota bacterium]